MGTIGGSELIIVLVIVMVLFGASAIPKLAKSIGQAKREFESGIKVANDAKPTKSVKLEEPPTEVSTPDDKES